MTFTGQRIRWMMDAQSGSYREVSQQKAIDELEEIRVERNTKKISTDSCNEYKVQKPSWTDKLVAA